MMLEGLWLLSMCGSWVLRSWRVCCVVVGCHYRVVVVCRSVLCRFRAFPLLLLVGDFVVYGGLIFLLSWLGGCGV